MAGERTFLNDPPIHLKVGSEVRTTDSERGDMIKSFMIGHGVTWKVFHLSVREQIVMYKPKRIITFQQGTRKRYRVLSESNSRIDIHVNQICERFHG